VRRIVAAGNRVVPAVLADEAYKAEDPVAVLGLVRLVELRGWERRAGDAEIDATLRHHGTGPGGST